jgi:predicted DNA-binding transcriptional regulator AlpA
MAIQHRQFSRALRLRKVCDLVGYAPASIWRKVKTHEFPAPFQLGPNASAWDENEVLDWLETKKATRVTSEAGK